HQLALLALGEGFALFLLKGTILAIEQRLLFRPRQAIHHADTARRVLDMDHGLVVAGSDLDRRVLGAGGGTADQERNLKSLALHLPGDMDHLIRSEEHTSELQSLTNLPSPLLLHTKNTHRTANHYYPRNH